MDIFIYLFRRGVDVRFGIFLVGLILAGCGGGGGGGGSGSSSGGGTTAMDLSVSTTASNALLSAPFMGHSKLMVGFSEGSAVGGVAGDAAPFDMQYQYLSSTAFGSPYNHANCLSGVTPIASCKGWITWQEDSATRGLFATRFVSAAKARNWNAASRPQIPFFTYYMLLQASGRTEGPGTAVTDETSALNDPAFMTNYFDDWRFLLQKIGTDQAMLHIEPDLFGFLKLRADQTTGLPSAVPATVALSNPTDCGTGYTEDAAGFAKCMIHMVRRYAPNAKVGLHASPFTYTNVGDANSVATFMLAMGAAQADFLVVDSTDRDADWYRLVGGQAGRDWDLTKMTAFLQWVKDVSAAVNKPVFLWQLPLGNSYQNNTYQHYKDQRVELLFAHIAEVRDAHIVGMLFGPGETAQTNVETDGGLLIGKTKQHYTNRGGD